MNMLLYHGTAAKHLDSIKKYGLLPRAMLNKIKGTKSQGNWTHSVTSNRGAVYLTDAYAFHFAHCAGEDIEKDKGLLLELDRASLNPWLLCPDEDYIEQSTRGRTGKGFADPKWDMIRRTKFYRKHAQANTQLTDYSLEGMGTAAYYGPIPWSAIKRYVIVDWSKMPHGMLWRAVDTQVSCINYRILQDRQRALMRWFFGDPVELEDFIGFKLADNPSIANDPVWKKHHDAIAAELPQTEGLERHHT